MMARPRRELAIAHGAQFPAQDLLGHRDAIVLENPLCEINQPPAHLPVGGGIGAVLDLLGKGAPVLVLEQGRLARNLAILEALRTLGRKNTRGGPRLVGRLLGLPGNIRCGYFPSPTELRYRKCRDHYDRKYSKVETVVRCPQKWRWQHDPQFWTVHSSTQVLDPAAPILLRFSHGDSR